MIDDDALTQAISGNSPDIKVFKKSILDFNQFLGNTFDPKQSSVQELTELRSNHIDHLLKVAWTHYFNPDGDTAALIAVGGYGRKELFPGSDIDLMILTGRVLRKNTLDSIQQFLTFLWDIGLEVGHSVRTVRDTVVEARADITIVTNIMEARFLIGDDKLFETMQKNCGPNKIWPSRPFFLAKYDEQQQRYAKVENAANRLEPNIKEGPGGLRDIQSIFWVAKRHFAVNSLEELVGHNYLTPEEYEELNQGLEYLGTLRMALHLLTGRQENRLLFDYQRELATQFGFSGEGNEPIEAFMQQYFRTVIELQRLSEMLLQHFQDDIDLKPRWGIRKIKTINSRFQTRRGYLEVKHEKVFENNPFALLEIFQILQQHPDIKGVTAATIRLIRQYRHIIDDEYRADARARGYFMEILRQPHGVYHELKRMNRYGILAAYLPEFENIVGRMQYDLFHAYTVDEHTLFVIRNLRRFTVPEFKHEFPLCSQIMATLPKPELVYIAALYHDIAKGRGGDHSELGAKDARNFCERHGLGEYDTDLVCWLVENHLLMSQTSQKQDIADAEVIHQFATTVADSVRLSYLYVLTVADMRATNPSLWNYWKENLLNELYNSTNRLYRFGMVSEYLQSHRLSARKKEAYETLVDTGIDPEKIESYWARLPDEYFLRHAVDDIVWQTRTLIEQNFTPLPVVRTRGDKRRGISIIFLYARDQANLFAHCASALAQLRLNITDARILETNDSYAINTYIVYDEHGKAIMDPMELKIIEQRIHDAISLEHEPAATVDTRIPRTLQQFKIRTFVEYEQDEQNQRTILRLRTTDRPGILSRVGQVFMEHDIRLHNARIATFGERAEDSFFISSPDKCLITDSDKLESLKKDIIDALSSD